MSYHSEIVKPLVHPRCKLCEVTPVHRDPEQLAALGEHLNVLHGAVAAPHTHTRMHEREVHGGGHTVSGEGGESRHRLEGRSQHTSEGGSG